MQPGFTLYYLLLLQFLKSITQNYTCILNRKRTILYSGGNNLTTSDSQFVKNVKSTFLLSLTMKRNIAIDKTDPCYWIWNLNCCASDNVFQYLATKLLHLYYQHAWTWAWVNLELAQIILALFVFVFVSVFFYLLLEILFVGMFFCGAVFCSKERRSHSNHPPSQDQYIPRPRGLKSRFFHSLF